MAPYSRESRHVLDPLSCRSYPGLINFLNPEAYPELYAVENRMDSQHLTANGAAVMSRLAGQRIAERLATADRLESDAQ